MVNVVSQQFEAGDLCYLSPLLLMLLALLSGCSMQTSFMPMQSTLSDDPAMLLRLEQEAAAGQSVAVISLLKQSRQQWQEGNLDHGLVILHRALRINPDDPLVYYYMAMIQSALGEWHKASQLAHRTLALTDAPLLRKQVHLFLVELSRLMAPEAQSNQAHTALHAL